MIKTFKSPVLKELFETGASRRVDTKLAKRCIERMTALHTCRGDLRAINRPGWELHPWGGYKTKWSISVSGPWRITFDWINKEAYNVDLEQPHG